MNKDVKKLLANNGLSLAQQVAEARCRAAGIDPKLVSKLMRLPYKPVAKKDLLPKSFIKRLAGIK